MNPDPQAPPQTRPDRPEGLPAGKDPGSTPDAPRDGVKRLEDFTPDPNTPAHIDQILKETDRTPPGK